MVNTGPAGSRNTEAHMNRPKFDPAHIVFSFGAISDWHIKDEEGQYNQQKLISALTQLRDKAAEEDAHGLATLIAAGDLTHDGKENEIATMKHVLTSVIDLQKTAFVYVAGNHDKHDPDCNLTYDRLFSEDCAKAYDTCGLSPDGTWSGARHISVRGVHFITLGPDKFHKKEANIYPEQTKQWLDETLARITAEDPNAYVFVITHLLMWGTCYGSVRGYFYASDDLTPILSKYPQVVTFGGHLHYPLNDDRAIMQTSFTAMETATLSDMLIDGHGLANVFKNTKTEGNTDFAQGLLVQIDADGNLRITRMDFKHCVDIVDNEIQLAIAGIIWGENNTTVIDYCDQIYFPNVKHMRCPQYDWVFIDECQDLNAAQRELFLKCVKPGGRFIAVGDPRQAIYGFSGADVESFNLLKAIPHTAKLPLSVCYRCDKTIIELAKTIVPQITWRDNAPDGIIDREAKMADVKDGDMILCRVTAPLVDLCMKYIANGTKAYVKGKEIGTNLINLIKRTNRKRMSEAMERLERELGKIIGKIVTKQHCSEAEAKQSDMYQTYLDKINAIQVLSEGLTTTDEVINRIESIFNNDSKNGICLSTIHKSKGLESDRVFIICEDKLYLKHCMQVEWMAEQERNLVYVAYTRAKHYLGFIQDFKPRN